MSRTLIGIGLSCLIAHAATAQEAPVIAYRSVRPDQPGEPAKAASIVKYGLLYEDYDRIREQLPAADKVVPVREIPAAIRNNQRSIEGRVVATTAGYADLAPIRMARGRFLTPSDDARFENYVVLGPEVAAALFVPEKVDPIGRAVKLGSNFYTVVGVAATRGAPDKDVFIPLSTCRLRFGERIVDMRSGSMVVEETQLSTILIRVGATGVEKAKDACEAILRRSHPRGDYRLVPPQATPAAQDRGGAAKNP